MFFREWSSAAGKKSRSTCTAAVRTVQRWEGNGLPVHRPSPNKRSHVIAHSEELDRWIKTGSVPGCDYPQLIASLTTTQKLRDENLARVKELLERVLRLSERVSQLRARRTHMLGNGHMSAPEMEELAD